jgi:hypothetical protein
VLAQQFLVQLRIQAERADRGCRIRGTYPIDHRQREARRRVHREIEGDEVRLLDRCGGQLLAREIDRLDLDAGTAQPCRRGRQPERLAPEVVGVD